MLMSPIKIFFEDNYYEVCVLASIWISMSGDFVGEEILIDNMIDSADKAMYKVKWDEKNYYSF